MSTKGASKISKKPTTKAPSKTTSKTSMIPPDSVVSEARNRFRTNLTGVLSTISVELKGYPFGSVIPFSVSCTGIPVVLISDLAQHTLNLKANNKCSLTIYDTQLLNNHLESWRITIIGELDPLEDKHQEEMRYLQFYPGHLKYLRTHDFHYYMMKIKRIRYIGGPGKIYWIDKKQWQFQAPKWQKGEHYILDHINAEHHSPLKKLQKYYFPNMGRKSVDLAALDPGGMFTIEGGIIHYIPFDKHCFEQEDLKCEFIHHFSKVK